MPQPQSLVINISPATFFKRLAAIEFILAMLAILFYLTIDLPQVYDNLQFARLASYTLITSVLMAIANWGIFSLFFVP
jgi:hypothetical protein